MNNICVLIIKKTKKLYTFLEKFYIKCIYGNNMAYVLKP